MPRSRIRFTAFPRTKPPPSFALDIVGVFRSHESEISTAALSKGLQSDEVLRCVRDDLEKLGFDVETGRASKDRIERPVFFGEGGAPTLRYEVDAYHPGWKCGLEVEAGRAIMGNAVFRDLFQAMVMVDVDTLGLAVPNAYRFKSTGKDVVRDDYEKTVNIADALFSHSRVRIPFDLIVIGY